MTSAEAPTVSVDTLASDPAREQEDPLQGLRKHRHIWQASRPGWEHEPMRLATGYGVLDELFGGWPGDGMTELLADRRGIGELRILLPALVELSKTRNRWIALIAPPAVPYGPALEEAGMDISRLLLIYPRNHEDFLWATEQTLRSGNCSAVLSWPTLRLRNRDLQRFRLAARNGRCWHVLHRDTSVAELPSPADLRLQLRPSRNQDFDQQQDQDALEMRVLKRRGAWATDFFQLQLRDDPRSFGVDHLQAQLERWRQQRLRPQPAVEETTPPADCTVGSSSGSTGRSSETEVAPVH